MHRGNQVHDPSDNDSDAEQDKLGEEGKNDTYLPHSIPTGSYFYTSMIFSISQNINNTILEISFFESILSFLVYKIGSRSEFPTASHASNQENNFTTSLKNYNDPQENDDPNFVTDSTTILLSGVSNLALNGKICRLKFATFPNY